MSEKSGTLDRITVEIIGSALLSIAEEMGIVLVRSAFSPNIKERQDCSTALFDWKGRTLAQAEHIPLHLGSLLGVVEAVIETYGKNIHEGDAFVANDPYLGGGTHLPDVTVVNPLFYDEGLIGYAATIAHHADIGGATPGGIAGSTETIYAEGLRIPPVRLQRDGEIDEDFLRLFRANCRQSDQRETDLRGQLAANRIADRRMKELLQRFGVSTFRQAAEELLEYGERRLRSAISRVPDGHYSYEDYLDDDGVIEEPIAVRVQAEIKGDDLHLDFTGTALQVRGAINIPMAALRATVYYAVKAVLEPDLPPNGGFHQAIRITAPPGTLVNPRPPAAVGARTDACQRVAGVILGALAKAIPERVPAPSHDSSTSVVFAGYDVRVNREFVYVEAVGGGGGARPDKEGLDGIQVHITNTANLPVEVLEHEYPLRVERYSLRKGSGGTGRFRGGCGIRRDVRVLCDNVVLSTHADRQRLPPLGLAGGNPGATGRFILNPGTPEERILHSKVAGFILNEGDLLSVQTPGGGGYGRTPSWH